MVVARRGASVRHIEGTSYITNMLTELSGMAAERDRFLAYLVDMAVLHSSDLDSGRVEAVPEKAQSCEGGASKSV